MWNQKPCLRFEIGNLSKKKAAINSKVFISGGCEWYLNLHPKGDTRCDDHVSLYLCVAKLKSLGRGWERSAKFYFVLLNQSDKELYKSPIGKKRSVFCAKRPALGFPKTLPFQEKWFLEKDRLIIEVYIKVFKAFDGVGVVSKTNKTMDINCFQVLASQVTPVRKIFAEPPDLAEDFKPKKQVADHVKYAYAKYVKSRMDEFFLRKRVDADGSECQQLEERVEDISLEREKTDDADETDEAFDGVGGDVSETKETMDINGFQVLASQVSLKDLGKSQIDADGSRVQQLEERVEDVSLERKKTYDADGSRIQQLQARINNLELMVLGFKVDCLKSKLEDVHLEMKKSDDADI
ncbi:MATH domain and coiled-coil domain-containing protein [Cardamine amara subsp. amara]|uniref:MATH domain and coiled-coil domain-containing protein n=1 Tax=Cardamine amara subsp. amara TaxID=228776 RepID=A0ABD0Z1Z7_CARAN